MNLILPRPSRALRVCASLVLAALSASCAVAVKDSDDGAELIQRSGDLASVEVVQGNEIAPTPINPLVPWLPAVYYQLAWQGWSPELAQGVTGFFKEALINSQAFAVFDHVPGQDNPATRLLLRCAVTRIDPNAKGSHRSAGIGGFLVQYLGWLGVGGGITTQVAEVDVSVEVVDLEQRRVIKIVRGQGSARGNRTTADAFSWGNALSMFASGSGTDYENVNVQLAIQRAVVRAVNSLTNEIPPTYFDRNPLAGDAGNRSDGRGTAAYASMPRSLGDIVGR
ncbi:MAG: hypothetical protein IPM29_08065 [Planctomycetes bacterium]|nr:hypothetical protein [Planctomycetota bacterium]